MMNLSNLHMFTSQLPFWGADGELHEERHTRPDTKLYFRIAESLIKYSRVFFVRQLMLTEPR